MNELEISDTEMALAIRDWLTEKRREIRRYLALKRSVTTQEDLDKKEAELVEIEQNLLIGLGKYGE